METKQQLTLANLYQIDKIEEAFKNDQFNLIANSLPKKDWIKENKYAGNSKYIPIGIIETLLLKMFKTFRVEVIESKQMFNSVAVTVRLHYPSPIDGKWTFHDGVGAVELQTKAESGTLKPDFSNINKGAVMMALPMAKSFALKDAAEHIGAIFGRDLNRKDVLEYTTDKNLDDKIFEREKLNIIDYINKCDTDEQFAQLEMEAEFYGLSEYLLQKRNENEQRNG